MLQLPSSPHYNLDVVNELTNNACEDSERLMHELGIDARIQGKKYAGPCPVHDGDNPSAFNFYPDGETVRGIWVCRTHRCHEKYKKTLVGLIQGIKSRELGRKYTWKEATEWLTKFNGLESISNVKLPDEKILQKRKVNRVIHKLNISPNQKTAGWSRDWVRKQLIIPSDYYVSRGYSEKILDKYDVGYYKPLKRVSVPVYDDNYQFCVGFTARSLNEQCQSCGLYHGPDEACPTEREGIVAAAKWRNSKDFETSNYLYNYWFAREHIVKSGVGILVEGPGDVWRLEENNVKISLALFGVELKEQQRVILDRSGALSLIILLDNDEPGMLAAKELRKKLGRAYRLYFPKITSKDVGDLHADSITNDIEPIINQIMGVK